MTAESPFDVAGRTAVVTGAASGIGRATALALANAGARLVLGDVAEAGLAETAEQVTKAGADCEALRTDVSARADCDALVGRALERFGRVDVLANVAGILCEAPVAELQEAELDRVLAVNLKGVLFGCQAALPAMTAQGSGSIVNVASSAAFEPYPGLAAYAISKSGVVTLTRVLALEAARAGVRVNAVAPGMIDTPMAMRRAVDDQGRVDAAKRERVLERTRQRNPLGIEGRPEDVAHAVLFLASDAARYITGQVLHPNGGSPLV
ncbi:MAG: SDR family NAD(P)-dependent oxidoreductase [Myxococcota bacterium]|nr:SDR family NAD(P)-dependent oxidoreductase [Myxococcota bacterium]